MKPLDLQSLFFSAPLIYGSIALLSLFTLTLFIQTLFTYRKNHFLPPAWITQTQELLTYGEFEKLQLSCLQEQGSSFSPLIHILSVGLQSQSQGIDFASSAMRAETERLSALLSRPITLLYDISTIAPMLGLLGTVSGLFSGLYQARESMQAILTLFDGLSVAMGTTIAGLLLALLAHLLAALLKWHLVSLMSQTQAYAQEFATLLPKKKRPAKSQP